MQADLENFPPLQYSGTSPDILYDTDEQPLLMQPSFANDLGSGALFKFAIYDPQPSFDSARVTEDGIADQKRTTIDVIENKPTSKPAKKVVRRKLRVVKKVVRRKPVQFKKKMKVKAFAENTYRFPLPTIDLTDEPEIKEEPDKDTKVNILKLNTMFELAMLPLCA